MSEKQFTLCVEDDGYWIRDERDFKIIATGLKLGVAANLIAYLNELNDENVQLKEKNEQLQKENSILNKNEDDLKECTLENIQLKEENERLIEKRGELETKIVILKKENEQLRKKLEQIYGFKGLNCRCVR